MTLARRTPLRADRERTAAWRLRSRKRLPALSSRRRKEKPERDAVRAALFQRDGYCRLLTRPEHSCSGPLTPHHLRKASAGGPYSLTNLVAVCAGGNTDIEDHPWWAWEIGLVERHPESPEDTWRRLWKAGMSRFPYPGSRP